MLWLTAAAPYCAFEAAAYDFGLLVLVSRGTTGSTPARYLAVGVRFNQAGKHSALQMRLDLQLVTVLEGGGCGVCAVHTLAALLSPLRMTAIACLLFLQWGRPAHLCTSYPVIGRQANGCASSNGWVQC
jgi:hypothetical protein